MSQIDKILVVEDDDTLRLLTTKQLARLGFMCDAVENGSHALRKTSEINYRLILMDVQMPQMDGIEATLAIRDAEKAAGRVRVPIIAVTANPDKSLCLNADMDDFLFKPVMLPELEQIMKKWVGAPKTESPDKTEPQKSEESQGGASSPQFGFAKAPAIEADTLVAAESDVTAAAAEVPEIIDASGSGNVIE